MLESRTKDLSQQILQVKQYYNIDKRQSLWPDEARDRINNLNAKRTFLTRERQLLSIYKGRSELYQMMRDLKSKNKVMTDLEWKKSMDVITTRKEALLEAATDFRSVTLGNLTDSQKLDILNNIKENYSLFINTTIQNRYDILMERSLRGDSRAMIDLRTLFIDESARNQGWLEGMETIEQNPSKSIETLIIEDMEKILDKRNKTFREVLGLLYND